MPCARTRFLPMLFTHAADSPDDVCTPPTPSDAVWTPYQTASSTRPIKGLGPECLIAGCCHAVQFLKGLGPECLLGVVMHCSSSRDWVPIACRVLPCTAAPQGFGSRVPAGCCHALQLLKGLGPECLLGAAMHCSSSRVYTSLRNQTD